MAVMRAPRKPGEGVQWPGSKDLYEEQKRRGAQHAKRCIVTHCIEGEYVTYQDMADRVGCSKASIEKRFRLAKKQPGAVTWASLGVKA